jgi:hypothetical protein
VDRAVIGSPASPRRSYLRPAADLARAAAVVSLLYSATALGGVAAALFALVLLGVTLPRVFRLSPALDASLCAVLLIAAWSALLDWYVAYPWLDVAVHTVATGLIALTVYVVLVRIGLLHPPDAETLAHPFAGSVLSVTALGLGLSVLWELGEWWGQTYLDPRIQTGYDDTIGDLTTAGFGAFLAAVVLVRAAVSSGTGSSQEDRTPGTVRANAVRHR